MSTNTDTTEVAPLATHGSWDCLHPNNAQALSTLLDLMLTTSLTSKDQGNRFEYLTIELLNKDSQFIGRFIKIQPYRDWAREHPDLAEITTDIGIDLIATNTPSSEGEEPTYTAIQCKFYGKESRITKRVIDSFCNASDKTYFSARILVATNIVDLWSENALVSLLNKRIPVQVITRADLENSSIDWSYYFKTDFGKIRALARPLYPFQVEAVESVLRGLSENDRGKLIMASGTGKTLVSLRVAERIADPNGMVLVVLPTRTILSQTLSEWKHFSELNISAFAVCSDVMVGKSLDPFFNLTSCNELSYAPTTSPKVVAHYVNMVRDRINDPELNDPTKHEVLVKNIYGMTVIFTTYQSIDLIAVAQHKYGLPVFDLVICDEAQHTTGYFDYDAPKSSSKKKSKKAETVARDTSLAPTSPDLIEYQAENQSEDQDQTSTSSSGLDKRYKNDLGIVNDQLSINTFIHNADYVLAKKRLYMTATPKVFIENFSANGNMTDNYEVFSIDDETVYGPTLYELSHAQAVKLGVLVDFKVIVIVETEYNFMVDKLAYHLPPTHCARIVATWKALNKYSLVDLTQSDPNPIKTAIGFAQVITTKDENKLSSEQLTQEFAPVIEAYKQQIEKAHQADPTNEFLKSEHNFVQNCQTSYSCQHIFSDMSDIDKKELLSWLNDAPTKDQCKILFNTRFLSEGVDTPSLEAVIFFCSRQSQVDLSKAITRALRCAPGKMYGYIILPIVLKNPDSIRNIKYNANEFKIVWQALFALKNLNPDLDFFNKTQGQLDDHVQIICLPDLLAKAQADARPEEQNVNFLSNLFALSRTALRQVDQQEALVASSQGKRFFDGQTFNTEGVIKSALLNRFGSGKSWEDWAEEADTEYQDLICKIETLLEAPLANQQAFERFKEELSFSMRVNLNERDVIEMLAQHILVKPILDVLFHCYNFAERNHIALAFTNFLQQLDQGNHLLEINQNLSEFYYSLRLQLLNVHCFDERRRIIVMLCDRFFKIAFHQQWKKHDMIDTPNQIIDFINRSVNDLLQQEFGLCLASPNVHILDPFTGKGSFITRLLLDPELIPDEHLQRKYTQELHGYENTLLAYYAVSINVESAYADRANLSPEQQVPNNVIALTDTFATYFNQKQYDFAEYDAGLQINSEVRDHVEQQPLTVILGNSIFYSDQDKQKGFIRCSSYPELGVSLLDTYIANSGRIQNKNALYATHIKALRWASDELQTPGIIAFISSEGLVNSLSTRGVRRCLSEEFTSIYTYSLRGNKYSREQSKQEGGVIYEGVCKMPISITFLVKNPKAKGQCKIFFGRVDDFLTRKTKLDLLTSFGSILNTPLEEVHQDDNGDWINQGCDDFAKFIPMDGQDHELGLFKIHTNGVESGRDAWSYNADGFVLATNMSKCINCYNEQLEDLKDLGPKFTPTDDATQIKWTSRLKTHFARKQISPDFDPTQITTALYRPFVKELLYLEWFWINGIGQTLDLFPYAGAENLVIATKARGSLSQYSCLITDCPCSLGCINNSHCFPRYVYKKANTPLDTSADSPYDTPPFGLLIAIEQPSLNQSDKVINGYVREDAIPPECVKLFSQAYPKHVSEIDADRVFYYVYGILSCKEYQETYANNLKKELPRIPRVATYEEFVAFEQAGRKLADLQVNYELATPYEGCTIEFNGSNCSYHVTQLKYGQAQDNNGVQDKTVIIYNDDITIRNIPLEVQEYVINGKSALDWVVEMCGVIQDKDSLIVNDYNDYAKAMENEKYIFNLILRVITVSLKTLKILKSMPKLNIHPIDK